MPVYLARQQKARSFFSWERYSQGKRRKPILSGAYSASRLEGVSGSPELPRSYCSCSATERKNLMGTSALPPLAVSMSNPNDQAIPSTGISSETPSEISVLATKRGSSSAQPEPD